MLHRGRRDARRPRGTATADLGALPFPAGRFAVVWCRLASGHLQRLAPLYRELARVLSTGGRAVVTDFHPEAIRAGHRRIFRDASGKSHEVTHVVHEPHAHEREAAGAGLAFEARLDYGIGSEVRPFWERAGALDRFARERGSPLLLAFRFRKGLPP